MDDFRFRLFFYVQVIGFSLFILFVATIGGCVQTNPFKNDDLQFKEMGGGQMLVLQLPMSPSLSLQCTQGADGPFSHGLRCTRYDIDLDTSNSRNESVFAPVGGVVFVHEENPQTGFGRHVSIDLGNGTYVVLGHLSSIAVSNAQEVSVGQFLGFEGCTGNCSGDHIHIGLHRGDARQTADQGESIPATYRVSDPSISGGFTTLTSEDFHCGLLAAGDPENGDYYRSVIQPALFHPDGALVKTLGDPRVYRLEESRLRWIMDESVFHSYGYSFENVLTISAEERACYGGGDPISQQGMVRARREVLLSWGISLERTPLEQVSSQDARLTDWPVREGFVLLREGSLVKEQGASDVFVITTTSALPIRDWETFVLLGYKSRSVIELHPGDLAGLSSVIGNCQIPSLCLSLDTVRVCGGTLRQGNVGGPAYEDPAPEDQPELILDPDAQVETSHEDPDTRVENRPDAGTPVFEDDPPAPDAFDDESEEENAVDRCDDYACIIDADQDGRDETLILSDDLWVQEALAGLDAFVYANGGCFDGTLSDQDRYLSENDHYFIDFSRFDYACQSQFTLISSVGSDGNPPDDHMGNWNWWQTGDYCAFGSPLCELMNNGTTWEEWLLSVAWDPVHGLVPNGNGLTLNAQR